MADETTGAKTPKNVKMPRAVHELRTGKGAADLIDPGTIITDVVATRHKLSDAAIESLKERGAVVDVEVLTA